ncbi:MAG: alpha-amylase family glycosyl hydrolase [Corynebacterium sp.]|nr:alpha-amylase family glycosyl hydrolase [Corynebacterium sp.]
MSATWTQHAIFWQVYPLGFSNAPIWHEHDEEPRLASLTAQLDYVVALGANGLILGPIFRSHTHGYDTIDHFQIDPRLGTLEDFEDLVTAAHARGIRIILDGVFSHAGQDFVHPELFDAAAVFEGHADLRRLDHTNPATVRYVQEVMEYWLARGVDGWRLDAAYSVAPDFWAQIIPRVQQKFPESWHLAEVIHGDYDAFIAASHIDSLTQYELWKAIWSALKEENFFELDWSLQRHQEFLRSFIPQTFIGNHDVTRIASQVGRRKALSALAILLTVGGIPSMYYGDELGYTGIKEERFRGDDAIRPVFDFTGSSEQLVMLNAHKALIALRRQHPWLLQAELEVITLENTRYEYRAINSAAPEQWIRIILDKDYAEIQDSASQILWSTPDDC